MEQRLQASDKWREWCEKLTWYDILEMAARERPQQEALVFGDKRITYREYLERVNEFAKGLFAAGVRKGDHLALWMTNRPEWCYLRFAINKLGARFIPINTRYRADEMEYVLAHSDSKVLIMEDLFLGKIDVVGMIQGLCPELATSERGKLQLAKFPQLKSVICLSDKQYPGCFSLKEVVESGKGVSDDDIRVEASPEDLTHIMYTSGTTGVPKGSMQTSKANIASLTVASELWGLGEGDRLLNIAPFFGNMGYGMMSMCVIQKATLVSALAFEPEDTLRTIEQEKITHIFPVPTMMIMMLEHPNFGKYDISSLKAVATGGAYIPRKLINDWREKTGVRALMPMYGLVEGGGIDTWVPANDTEEHIEKTVGMPMPHCQVGILDISTGQPLPPGQEGEVCIKGVIPGAPNMMGYYKMPEKTAEAIREGWLHTGDLGKMREDGYLEFTGRVKELIIVGGFNVAPAEIEEFLLKHPKIEQAAVTPVPDKRLGEVPAAFIRLKSGETATAEEIIEFCRDKVANTKVPRYVFFVDRYPLTAQGKVQKFKLTEMAVKELGLKAD